MPLQCSGQGMVGQSRPKYPFARRAVCSAHLDVRHLPLAMQEPRPVLLRAVCLDDDQDDVPVVDADFALLFIDFLFNTITGHAFLYPTQRCPVCRSPSVAVFLPPDRVHSCRCSTRRICSGTELQKHYLNTKYGNDEPPISLDYLEKVDVQGVLMFLQASCM